MKPRSAPIALSVVFLLAISPAVDSGRAQEPEERFITIDTLNVRDTLYHLV